MQTARKGTIDRHTALLGNYPSLYHLVLPNQPPLPPLPIMTIAIISLSDPGDAGARLDRHNPNTRHVWLPGSVRKAEIVPA